MDAAEKFFTIPELGERLFSLLDPLSSLRLIESSVMEKKILQKSLSFAAWSNLIRGISNAVPCHHWKMLRRKEAGCKRSTELVGVLVKILHFLELEEPSTFLMPLLDQICEFRPGNHVQMICPCHQEPHFISTEAFLLLEEVEGAFGTTQQSLKSMVDVNVVNGSLLPAISSRMSRQKEIVSSIQILWGSFHIKDKSSVEAFVTLLKADRVYVKRLDVGGEIGEEGWQTLNRALQGKNHVVGEVFISRQSLAYARDISIKGIWDATTRGFSILNFMVVNFNGRYSEHVSKNDHEWDHAWARLKQISDMDEDEFIAECQLREAFEVD